MELIDCYFTTIDAARRSGMTYSRFMDLAEKKLTINKARIWPRSTGDNNKPIEHDRSKD